MSFGSMMRGGLKIAKIVAKPVAKVASNPFVQMGASFIPGGGLITKGLALAGTAAVGYGAIKALSPSAAPRLPSMPGGGLPSLPMGNTGGTGLIPKGPGGRVQLPWSDPSTPDALKAFALDDQYIRPAMRAPKGYVIVHDANGRPYPLLRSIAIKFHLWKPKKKPIISVRDSQAIKRSAHAIKRLHKFVRESHYVHDHVGKGGKVHFKKKAKAHHG